MTFDERLAQCRAAYARGKAEREAAVGVKANAHADYGVRLAGYGRADLASYWLGATERGRVVLACGHD